VFCPKCGAQNEPGVAFCTKCGNALSQQAAQPSVNPAANPAAMAIHAIPTYLVQAILVTLFCCLPFGIVAIVKASGVSKWQGLGNYDLALKTSNEAKTWCWVAFGSSFVVVLLYIAFIVLIGVGSVASHVSTYGS
jgi:hypothetical protein